MFNSGMMQVLIATAFLGGMPVAWANIVAVVDDGDSYIHLDNGDENADRKKALPKQRTFEMWAASNSNAHHARDLSASWQQVMFRDNDDHAYSQLRSDLEEGHRHGDRHGDDYFHHGREHHDSHTYVPIPAVIWLFGSGVLLLSGVALRRGTNTGLSRPEAMSI